MDVAVAIGADPATIYSAILPLPPDLDEMMLAGFLRNGPVEMVKCQSCDLEVPAQAEIVLEGYVELGELRTEGPFGDHTGYYSLADDYPVFHVTCITQRRDPIYAATIVGPPPMEDFYMGKAIERIFLPLMRLQLPEVRDISMPAEGVFHNLMLVSIRKSYPGHARKVMSRHLGAGAGDVHASASWWWTRTWMCRTCGKWRGARSTTSTRSATFSSSWGRSIRSTMPAACRTTAPKWGSMPRASGPAKASRGRGPK